jgi:hypothetical protein
MAPLKDDSVDLVQPLAISPISSFKEHAAIFHSQVDVIDLSSRQIGDPRASPTAPPSTSLHGPTTIQVPSELLDTSNIDGGFTFGNPMPFCSKRDSKQSTGSQRVCPPAALEHPPSIDLVKPVITSTTRMLQNDNNPNPASYSNICQAPIPASTLRNVIYHSPTPPESDEQRHETSTADVLTLSTPILMHPPDNPLLINKVQAATMQRNQVPPHSALNKVLPRLPYCGQLVDETCHTSDSEAFAACKVGETPLASIFQSRSSDDKIGSPGRKPIEVLAHPKRPRSGRSTLIGDLTFSVSNVSSPRQNMAQSWNRQLPSRPVQISASPREMASQRPLSCASNISKKRSPGRRDRRKPSSRFEISSPACRNQGESWQISDESFEDDNEEELRVAMENIAGNLNSHYQVAKNIETKYRKKHGQLIEKLHNHKAALASRESQVVEANKKVDELAEEKSQLENRLLEKEGQLSSNKDKNKQLEAKYRELKRHLNSAIKEQQELHANANRACDRALNEMRAQESIHKTMVMKMLKDEEVIQGELHAKVRSVAEESNRNIETCKGVEI